jgi:Lecithin retinol acyltransferase
MARGNHIYVPTKVPFIYHHGIDCGGNLVIEYSKNGKIELISKQAFAQEKDITIKYYPETQCFPPEFVVIRAYSRLGESKYSLLCNNCEHFASWCKTGNQISEQVPRLVNKLACKAPDIRPIVLTDRTRIVVS